MRQARDCPTPAWAKRARAQRTLEAAARNQTCRRTIRRPARLSNDSYNCSRRAAGRLLTGRGRCAPTLRFWGLCPTSRPPCSAGVPDARLTPTGSGTGGLARRKFCTTLRTSHKKRPLLPHARRACDTGPGNTACGRQAVWELRRQRLARRSTFRRGTSMGTGGLDLPAPDRRRPLPASDRAARTLMPLAPPLWAAAHCRAASERSSLPAGTERRRRRRLVVPRRRSAAPCRRVPPSGPGCAPRGRAGFRQGLNIARRGAPRE